VKKHQLPAVVLTQW